MAWSLMNVMEGSNVDALLDRAIGAYKDDPSFVPGMKREQAAAIIHAVIWAAGVRSDSFANAYAHDALFTAIGEDMTKWLQGRLEFEKRCQAAQKEPRT